MAGKSATARGGTATLAVNGTPCSTASSGSSRASSRAYGTLSDAATTEMSSPCPSTARAETDVLGPAPSIFTSVCRSMPCSFQGVAAGPIATRPLVAAPRLSTGESVAEPRSRCASRSRVPPIRDSGRAAAGSCFASVARST